MCRERAAGGLFMMQSTGKSTRRWVKIFVTLALSGAIACAALASCGGDVPFPGTLTALEVGDYSVTLRRLDAQGSKETESMYSGMGVVRRIEAADVPAWIDAAELRAGRSAFHPIPPAGKKPGIELRAIGSPSTPGNVSPDGSFLVEPEGGKLLAYGIESGAVRTLLDSFPDEIGAISIADIAWDADSSRFVYEDVTVDAHWFVSVPYAAGSDTRARALKWPNGASPVLLRYGG
jgi:hypothetical protein